MKLLGKLKFEGKMIAVPFIFGKGVDAKMRSYYVDHGIETWDMQKLEPVYITQEVEGYAHYTNVWAFKDHAIQIEDVDPSMTADDIKVHIKHFFYQKEARFAKIMKEVERFEKFEESNPITRETIPEDVRMYVWRRDQGKCVNCGSNKNLEFDHIIPVSEGGSSTERNIQLLCSDCNKKKSNHI